MSTDGDPIRDDLARAGLRVTRARVEVLRALRSAGRPVTHQDLTDDVSEHSLDRVTVYRNLNKLVGAGLVRLVCHVGGVARFEARQHGHVHPHFVCVECGVVQCLEGTSSPTIAVSERWRASVDRATVQLSGACPDCLGSPS